MIRENMSILIYRKDLKAVNIGHRETMSDIGATIADYFKVWKCLKMKKVFWESWNKFRNVLVDRILKNQKRSRLKIAKI